MSNNWIHIKPNQKVTYIVNGSFDYYLYMEVGSSVTFKGKNDGSYIISKNIWGPGSVIFGGGSVTINASIGVMPDKSLLTQGCWQYNTDTIVEEISSGIVSSTTYTTNNAYVGNTLLEPGDWLVSDGSLGGIYKHHFIYVGNGEFVGYNTDGVRKEIKSEIEGKKVYLKNRGGLAVAQKALSRIGENKYNLITNNCEHFCSSVSGYGHKSEQVIVGTGKIVAPILSHLGNSINSNPNVKFHSNMTGGFTTGGGFSGGISFRF